MNEDNRKKVYDVLKSQTGYQDSYDDFNSAFDANEDARKKVYDVLKSQTGYQDSYEDFSNLMFSHQVEGQLEGSIARQVASESGNNYNPEEDSRNTPVERMNQLIRENATVKQKTPSLKELVASRQEAVAVPEQKSPAVIDYPEMMRSESQDYRMQSMEPMRRDVERENEDKEVDRIYTPKQVDADADIFENYRNRFNLTRRGAELEDERARIQAEVENKYFEEFKKSPEYKGIVGRSFRTQSEADEANKALSDLFNQKYGEAINRDMKPYMDTINEEMFNRYGYRINEDLRELNKRDTQGKVLELVDDVDKLLGEKHGSLKNRSGSGSNAMNALMGSTQYNQGTAGERREIGALNSAKKLLEQSQNIMNEAGKKGNTNFVAGFARGLYDNSSWDNWAFGLSEMADAKYLNNAIEKFNKGESLTDAEEKLLEASAVNMATQAYFGSDLGRGYGAGQTTAVSLPFMMEFLVNPISSSGNMIAKSLLKYGIKKFGSAAASKGAKFAGRLLGDAAAAAGMEATTGVGRVAAGTLERLNDNYEYGFDENGNIKMEKVGDVSLGKALARSAASTFLENQSEMVFNAFRGWNPFMKAADNALPGRVTEFMRRIKESKPGQLFLELKNNPTFREAVSHAQFHGLPEEYLEEVYNNLANVAMGEMSIEDAIDLDNNIDTFLGLAPTSVMFGMFGLGSMGAERYSARRKMNKLYQGATDEQRARFDELKNISQQGGNEDIREFIKVTLADNGLSPQEKRDEMEYAYNLVKQNAADDIQNAETEEAIGKETESIMNSSDPSTGMYTEANRIIVNETGEEVTVPGYITGHINGAPVWQAEGSEERVVLKPGELDEGSVQSMPTGEVVSAITDMIREEAREQADRERRYSPDIAAPAIGMEFGDGNRSYQIVQKNPDGGWIVESQWTDEKGNPVQKMVPMSDTEYYDIMQAQIDAQEQQPVQLSKKILPDGRFAVQTGMNGNEVSYDITDSRGNLVDSDSMPSDDFSALQEYAPEIESSALTAEIRRPNAETSSVEYPVEISVPNNGGEQQSVVQEEATKESEKIPTDEKGNVLYHKVPVEVTVDTLDKEGLETEEVDAFVQANKEASSKLLSGLQGKSPKMGTNIAKYKADKMAWQEKVADAQAQVDYWNSVEEEISATRVQPGDRTAENIRAMGEPLDGNELAAQMLASGQLPLLYDDYKRETGFSSKDASGMFGLFKSKANGGLSIEEAGEKLMLADREAGTNFFDQGDANAGRNAILDVLSSVRTRGGLTDYIKNNRDVMAERERRAAEEYEERQRESWAQDNFGMSYADYMAYEESINDIIQEKAIPEDILIEFYNNFAEELNDLNNGRITEDAPVDDRQGDSSGSESSEGLLPSEQINNNRGIETDTSTETDGNTDNTGVSAQEGKSRIEVKDANQGNPVDGKGNLMVGEVESVSDTKQDKSLVFVPERRDDENFLDYAERVSEAKKLDDARKKVDTNPTDAQKGAGNYKKGHINIDGYDITIENPKGSERSGTDINGNRWSVFMNNDYGYIRGTQGVDGDHIDVFLSDNPSQGNVFVIDQVNEDSSFDEHKVMYGFFSEEEARTSYLANYSPGWRGLGPITEVTKDEFKKWVDSSHRKTKPFSEYKSVKAEQRQDEDTFPALEVAREKLGDIEQEWEDRIFDYIAEHYPTQATVSAQTNSLEGMREKAAMKNDETLKRMRAEADAEFNAADEEVMNLAENEKEDNNTRFREYSENSVGLDTEKVLSVIDKLSDVLHTPIRIVHSMEDLSDGAARSAIEEGRKIKAWNDLNTGDVFVYLPNVTGVNDVVASVLHEVVGHKGLREMFGKDRYDEVMVQLYEKLPAEVRSRIADNAVRKYSGNVAVAMDEYLAEQAEKDEIPSWWNKVVSAVRDFFRKMGIDVKLSHNDVKYLLWRSKKRLEEGNPLERAEDIDMRNKLGIGGYSRTPEEEKADYDKATNIVSNFVQNHAGAANTLVVRSRDTLREQFEEKGISLEDIDKYERWFDEGNTVAFWAPKYEELFVLDTSASEQELNGYLWHENTHKALHQLDDYDDMVSTISDYVEREFPELYGYVADMYKEDGDYTIREECVSHLLEYMAHMGRDKMDSSKVKLDEGPVRDAIRKLLDNINYGKRNNENQDGFREDIRGRENRRSGSTGKERQNSGNPEGRIDRKGRRGEVNQSRTEKSLTFSAPEHKDGESLLDYAGRVDEAYKEYQERKKNDERVRFREADEEDDGTREAYENAVSGKKFKMQEAYQDSMLALKRLQEVIEKHSGKKLQSFENAYMAENQMSSRSTRETEVYGTKFFKPMLEAVADLMEKGITYREVLDYMIAKHGLERNKIFAKRDAELATQNKYEKKGKSLDKEYNEGNLTEDEYNKRKDDLKTERDKYYNNLLDRNLSKDYSGLTALTGEEKDFEAAARQIVDEFESIHDTSELWNKVNAATKETLRKSYESGMMSRELYDKVRKQFKYYIPLRGWDEKTADDVYEYLNSKKSPVNSVLKSAHGRPSLSDDPLATIGNMAESTILQGNRNLMKQNFMNMVVNHPSDVATIGEAWYVKNTSTGDWVISFPDIVEGDSADVIAQKIAEHEERMLELEKDGDATKIKEGLNIDYRIGKRQAQEHIVNVKRNGKDYLIFVNGNPRAAQAVNGMTNPDVESNEFFAAVSKFNRQLAANFTTRNPAFVLSNLSRDLIFSVSAVSIKERPLYAIRFIANIPKAMATVARNLKGNGNENDVRDIMFEEFLANGGETGYTALHNVDEYKRMVKKELGKITNDTYYHKTVNKIKACAGFFSLMNRWAEDVSRFNAYMTSREEGRTITEAVNDAKEITVNFNKKGAGAKTGGIIGASAGLFRNLYLFFNASVQSLANFGRLAKKNRKGFITALGGFTAAGFIVPVLNQLAISMFGDGDEDDYYGNLPEWVRRNNICIYVGGGKFVTIPLPIELRAFYGLGEMAYQETVGNGKTAGGEIAYQAINQITELLPINPLGNNGDLVTTFIPDAFKPFWQINENMDFTGKPIYRKNAFNENMPEWTKSYKGTSEILVKLSEWTNELGGGDKYKKAAIDKMNIHGFYFNNPAQIEHLFEAYFGGMAKTVIQTGKTLAGMAESMIDGEIGDNLQWRNTPVLNRFVNDASDERSSFGKINQQYYKLYDVYEEVQKNLRGYSNEISRGNLDYLDKLDELYKSDDYKVYLKFKAGKKILDDIRKIEKNLPDAAEIEKERLQKEAAKMKKKIVEEVGL